MCSSGNKIIAGGIDGIIHIFGGKGGDIKIEKSINIGESSARGIDYLNGNILVGMRNGSIY